MEKADNHPTPPCASMRRPIAMSDPARVIDTIAATLDQEAGAA